jgi:hypothetical protein
VPEPTVIAPSGELDLAGATAFRAALNDAVGAADDGLHGVARPRLTVPSHDHHGRSADAYPT